MKVNFENNWMQKSIERLEKEYWPSIKTAEESHLVSTCNRLRKIQLKDFETEDLRIMIGQEIGLKYLVPLAIEKLTIDILVEGDYYPGDLLSAVLTIEKDFWIEFPTYWETVIEILEKQMVRIKSEEVSFEMKRDWYEKINAFKALALKG